MIRSMRLALLFLLAGPVVALACILAGIYSRGWAQGHQVRYSFVGVPAWQQLCMETGLKKWANVNGVTVTAAPDLGVANLVIKDAPQPQNGAYAQFIPTAENSSEHFTNGEILLHGAWDDLTSCDQWQSVAMHEMGHGFGLDDVQGASWTDTVMGASINASGLNADWSPNACDRQRGEEADTFVGPGAPAVQKCTKSGSEGRNDGSGCCNLDLELRRSPSWNILPIGHIMAPLSNTVVATGSSGQIKIDAADVDGTVYRVDWFLNGAYAATTWAPNLNLSYSNAPAGNYSIKAAMYDTAQEYAWTQPVTLIVGSYYATDTLSSGQNLPAGWSLVSSNSAYYATLTSSGSFNLYTAGGVLLGSTGTSGPPAFMTMQNNGNLTLSLFPSNPQVAWQTFTGSVNNFGAGLRVLSSGKIAVIRPDGVVLMQYP